MTDARLLVPSPLGDLVVEGTDDALTAVFFPGTVAVAAGDGPVPALLREARDQLDAFFAGDLRRFDLPLAPQRGGPFDRAVWSALRDIPFGETRSYGDVARAIGRPTSVRAVGAANGRNPLPIVVPCHRVIGADGSLTGFGGGLPAKRRLLALEAGTGVQTALL